jgi:HEAT repeat protein
MAEQLSEFHIDLIKQVGLGMNIARTYPKGHPSLMPVVQRLNVLLKEIPIEKESISLILIEKNIMIEEIRYSPKRLPIVRSMIDRFTRIGIKSITFSVDASENDIKEFFSAMAATTADLADYGDIETLMRSKGIIGIGINKYEVGVVSKDGEGLGGGINWEYFLESLVTSQTTMTDEERKKELGKFLAGIGVAGNEAAETQTEKIVSGMEQLAFMVADQYGEDRWDEYSLVFSRMLAVLSPNIKKNIIKYRSENKKLATLFRTLVPTMSDQDIIDIIATKAKEKSPMDEEEVVDILKNVTGARLPAILSSLRVNVPQIDFEKIATRLMSELKETASPKDLDKISTKSFEAEMRKFFPKLRDPSHEERNKAIDSLMEFAEHLFERENYDLIRLLADRFDTMADKETELTTFKKLIEAIKQLYVKSRELHRDDVVQFISRKFGKHLMRKEAAFLEKKNLVIRTIDELGDKNYVAELVSLLWDPGTFVAARDALICLSDSSLSLLIETLKETEDRSVRMKMLDVLVKIGEPAVAEVKKLLSSREWYIRRNGAFILGEMKATSAIDDIGRLLDDREERVQLEAVDTLHKIGGQGVNEYIKKALDSKHQAVAIEAMKFLERDDVKHKIGEILKWLKARKGIPNQKEEQTRCGVIEVLGQVGDDSVIATLVEVLNESAFFKGDLLKPTKTAALNALAKIKSPQALQALRDAAGHRDHFVAAVAQDILKRKESKQA